ncbi:hypothetical protein PGB90_006718 [Kerria lacca]
MKENVIVLLVAIAGIISEVSCKLQLVPESVDLIPDRCAVIVVSYLETEFYNGTITLKPEYPEIASVNPSTIDIENASQKSWVVQVCGIEAGYTVIYVNFHQITYYLHAIVGKFYVLNAVADFVGWIYFVAWSISFYPQIYENYVRKSVVGLNFDFLALNIVGFVLYSVFNCGLYYIPYLQKEYLNRHPKSLSPVQFNDVFFSVHASLASVITIIQCTMYERGEQKVSLITKMITMVFYLIVLITGVSAYINKLHWLDFLYYCSYIKLSTTLIKYIPQAVMNYERKSTIGWSIGNVMLDLIGGLFSIFQMFIMGFNYNDWENILGDPTKFGLGVFSISFDLFFMYQHYILYRKFRTDLIDKPVVFDEKAEINRSSIPKSQ